MCNYHQFIMDSTKDIAEFYQCIEGVESLGGLGAALHPPTQVAFKAKDSGDGLKVWTLLHGFFFRRLNWPNLAFLHLVVLIFAGFHLTFEWAGVTKEKPGPLDWCSAQTHTCAGGKCSRTFPMAVRKKENIPTFNGSPETLHTHVRTIKEQNYTKNIRR